METREPRDPIVVISFVVALVAVVGMVIAVPSLLPREVRDLVGLGPERLADARDASGGGTYAFFAHQRGAPGDPVGYDPCTAIRIRMNLDNAPEDSQRLVLEAMRRIEEAAGIRFAYEGTTSARPQWSEEERGSLLVVAGRPKAEPVLVSWADEDEVPKLADDVAGIGGSVSVDGIGGRRVYVTGGVTFDIDYFEDLMDSEEGRAEARAIVLHEFGHLLGLAHVRDGTELMNEDNVGRLDFGSGDLTGLAKLGAIPCT